MSPYKKMNLAKNKSSISSGSGQVQITAIVVLFLVLMLSVATAASMVQGDYSLLMISLGVGAVCAYFASLWRHTWVAAIFLALAGFSIAPIGFAIPSGFLASALSGLFLIAITALRTLGSPAPIQRINPGPSVRPVVILSAIWMGFLMLHGMVSVAWPVYPNDYSYANTAKAYAEEFAPVIVVVILYFLRYRMPDWNAVRKWTTFVMVVVMMLLLLHRLYLISIGYMEEEGAIEGGLLLIPGINLIPGSYALRGASPVVALWAAALLFCPYKDRNRSRFGASFLLFLAFSGALVSGGRVVPILVLLAIMGMAWVFRRMFFVVLPVIGMVLLAVFVNFAPVSTFEKMPVAVQRTVAIMRFERTRINDDIDNSTKMRRFLFEEGVKEWKSSPRIVVAGRGVRVFTRGDALINMQRGGAEETKWLLAVRTGRLHRTFGDIMIRYGIIGIVLYYALQLLVLGYLIKVFRAARLMQAPESAVIAMLLGMQCMNLFLGLVSNAAFSVLDAWFLMIIYGLMLKRGRSPEVSVESKRDLARRTAPGDVIAARI